MRPDVLCSFHSIKFKLIGLAFGLLFTTTYLWSNPKPSMHAPFILATDTITPIRESPESHKPRKFKIGVSTLETINMGIGWRLTDHQEFHINGALHLEPYPQDNLGILSIEHRWMFGRELSSNQRRFYWKNQVGFAVPLSNKASGVSTSFGINLGKNPRHSIGFDLGFAAVSFGGGESIGYGFPTVRLQKNFHF
jgi:hypothetical protein